MLNFFYVATLHRVLHGVQRLNAIQSKLNISFYVR